MAYSSNRKISISERKTATYAFSGVDYTTPRFSMASNNALDECNYVFRDKMVQKRFGYQNIFPKISEEYYIKVEMSDLKAFTKPLKVDDSSYKKQEARSAINGMWFVELEDNNTYLFVHKGKLLYYSLVSNNIDDFNFSLVVNKGFETRTIDTTTHKYFYTIELQDRKLEAFVGQNKLWLLTGEKFLRISKKANEDIKVDCVDELSDSYIPTTTIGITQAGAKASARTSFEPVNLMNEWRYNAIAGGIDNLESSNSDTYSYTLDSPIVFKNEEDMNDFEIVITTMDDFGAI